MFGRGGRGEGGGCVWGLGQMGANWISARLAECGDGPAREVGEGVERGGEVESERRGLRYWWWFWLTSHIYCSLDKLHQPDHHN